MSSTDDAYILVNDNVYDGNLAQTQIPVQADQAPVEDPIKPATADVMDQTLGGDDAEATDEK